MIISLCFLLHVLRMHITQGKLRYKPYSSHSSAGIQLRRKLNGFWFLLSRDIARGSLEFIQSPFFGKNYWYALVVVDCKYKPILRSFFQRVPLEVYANHFQTFLSRISYSLFTFSKLMLLPIYLKYARARCRHFRNVNLFSFLLWVFPGYHY